jgi:hypothetical protein
MAVLPPGWSDGTLISYDDPFERRWWLLLKALQVVPLDAAVNLARQIEEFLHSGTDERSFEVRCHDADQKQPASALWVISQGETQVRAPAPEGQPDPRALEIDKSAVMVRLEQGLSNAEVAAEFGLTQRQVQGYRMQMVRCKPAARPAAAEDIVRYLRQQGDVIVGGGEGQFLVNGRFTLSVEELLERANRIRSREGKELLTTALSLLTIIPMSAYELF